MSCSKCCFWPCDRTSACPELVYYVKDEYGNVIRMVEVPDSLKPIISKAVIKALESEV